MGSSVILPPMGQPVEGPDPSFKPSPYANTIRFAFEDIDPPSPLYIQRDDVLVITAMTAQSGGETVFVNVRELLAPFYQGGQPDTAPDGQPPGAVSKYGVIVPNVSVINLPTTFSLVTVTVPLTEGYLLSIGATASTATQRGITFVRIQIQRGTVSILGGPVYNTILSDYVTKTHTVGWPGSRTIHPAESAGGITTQTHAAPPVGTDWSFTLPPLSRAQVISFNAQLVTSATVASRIVRVQLLDPSALLVYQGGPTQSVPASQTVQVSGLEGQNTSIVDTTTINLALPSPTLLVGGSTIRVNTTGLQPGDQWGQQNFLTQFWLDNI